MARKKRAVRLAYRKMQAEVKRYIGDSFDYVPVEATISTMVNGKNVELGMILRGVQVTESLLYNTATMTCESVEVTKHGG